MEAMATSSKMLTKCMVQEIASSISEKLPPGLPKEVLEGMSTAAHVKRSWTALRSLRHCNDTDESSIHFYSICQSLTRRCRRGTDQNNSSHLLRKKLILLLCPRVTFYYVILEKRSIHARYAVAHSCLLCTLDTYHIY